MSTEEMATPLRRVRGLGSAQQGGEHWIRERLTSAALLLLTIWLVASLLMLPSLDQRTIVEWLRAASGAVPMALLIITAFIHAIDGLKVVIDDYVHDVGNNLVLNGLVVFAGYGGMALALFSLGRIVFGAGA